MNKHQHYCQSSSAELVHVSMILRLEDYIFAPGLILLSINIGTFSYPIICSQGELQGVHHEAKIFGFFNRRQ